MTTPQHPVQPAPPTAPHPVKPAQLSQKGCEFISRFEGWVPHLYDDQAGHSTIGFGHLVHLGHTNGSEPAEFKQGITKQRGIALLKADAAKAAATVRECVKVPINQARFDALVSFTFNVGGQAFRDSTLLRELNAGHYGAVPEQMMRWVHAGPGVSEGLRNRRQAEGALFSQGKYS